MNSIDAVLPLCARDLDRAEMLLTSLRARFHGLGTLWVVSPRAELALVTQRLSAFSDVARLRFESELTIAPELELVPLLKGWYKQQLIKLAIAERVESDFYLTLDADVVLCRELRPSALVRAGRAPCHVIQKDLHADWYDGSFATLGLTRPERGVLHNVTPAVLHRAAVAELTRYLTQRANFRRFSAGLRGVAQRVLVARARLGHSAPWSAWRLWLCASTPWTEYALYYGFLESSGRFEAFHEYTPFCIYDIERSVWRERAAAFNSFDATACFTGEGPPWFLVVQSNAKLAPALVREKLSRHLHV